MAAPVARLSLHPRAAEEIALLVQYADRLKAWVEFGNNQKPALSLVEAIEPLATAENVNERDVFRVFNALENLKVVKAQTGDASAAFDSLVAELRPENAKKLEEQRTRILTALEAYSSDNPISISWKAQKLAYLHEKIYEDAEIITDARPVFDSSGERVMEIIIFHYLVASYRTPRGSERVHLAMDADDLLKLRKACDRAIVKAKTLKASLSDKSKWTIGILSDGEAD